MSFEAHEFRLKQVFAGDNSYHIPRNQRAYVWEEKNWMDLAEDIKYVFSLIHQKRDISHFIGSFVFQQDGDEYIIIDGQQRITTLMIMLASICVLQNEAGDEEEFGITKQYLIGNIGLRSQFQRLRNDEISNLKLILGRATDYKEGLMTKAVFSDIPFNNNKKPNKSVLSCFWFFYNYFSDLSAGDIGNLATIRSIIVDMKVIHIISENELDCYEVFEILNARGASLNPSELLKNYIFKYVQPESTVDIAKSKWDKIMDNMAECNDNIEQFLSHYFTARFPKEKSKVKVDVFQLAKGKIPKGDINILLDELVKCSEIYKLFYLPDKHESKIVSEVLRFFNLEIQRQFRPIFIAYFLAYDKNRITKKELEKAFVLIRNFYFAFGLICKKSSNLIENSVYSVANNIYNSNGSVTASDFYSVFEAYYPSYDTFLKGFVEKGYSRRNKLYINSQNKKEINYILSMFEEYYQTQEGSELQCDLSQCNIEHIKNDSDDDTSCKIGNLLLISEAINSKIENWQFTEKVEYYKESRLLNVKRFIEHYGDKQIWNPDTINVRGEHLAKLAYESIWKFKL